MSFIQEKLLNIDLGLSKEHRLIQFSDVHVATYEQHDDHQSITKAINQEKLWLKQRLDFAHKFKENYDSELLLPSTECLAQLIEYANNNQPDLVLLTGDIIDYYSRANYAYLAKSIKRLNNPYLFLCGNHEYPSELFQDLCQGNCDLNYVEFDEFLVVSIHNSTRTIQPSQLSAFRQLLDYKKPIILTMHVPMMTEYNRDQFMKLDSYYSMNDRDCDEVTSNFIHLVCSSDEVKAVLCGHTHGSITSLIAPNKPQYCCSSGLIGSVNKIIIK
ncbi:MAG: metallophosphoesterase [Candidatus Izemoplasmatales bacterium]|jgi:3',5'-cyclic AMP phosphodiesterase CpdA